MKSTNCFIFSFLIILVMNNTYAGIITVNNVNPSPGQYSDLQTAINVAQSGDTLLIHRSTTSYGNATITKRLILIGEGALPNKSPIGVSLLGNITLTYNATTLEHASKSELIGLDMGNLNVNEKDATLEYSVDSVKINQCKIITLYPKGKMVSLDVSNSFIQSISNGNLINCKFYNNFLYSISASNGASGSNNLFINNIFFLGLSFNDGVVANNIFYNTGASNFSMSAKNVIFSNNILYGTSTTFDPTNYSANGNTSVNNQFNVDPMFVNPIGYTSIRAYTHTSPASGPFADFHLQTGSPAIGAGTDGKDLGIYGGSTPWRDGSTTDSRYRYYPLPDAVPVITGVTVQNPVVNEGGNLQIQLGATTTP